MALEGSEKNKVHIDKQKMDPRWLTPYEPKSCSSRKEKLLHRMKKVGCKGGSRN